MGSISPTFYNILTETHTHTHTHIKCESNFSNISYEPIINSLFTRYEIVKSIDNQVEKKTYKYQSQIVE